MINFDTVPSSLRVPGRYIEFNTRTAVQGLPQNPQKMVLITPKLASGTQPDNQPVQLFSDAQAADLFGAGSWAHLCVRQAFRNNAYLDLTVVGVPDATASVAATGKVVIAGTATTSGLATIKVSGVDYSVAVAVGDTADKIAKSLKTELDYPDCVLTAAVNGGTITLTAKNKGSIGNNISLTSTISAKGVTATITDMGNGAGAADITTALTTIAGTHYHIIASAYNDNANAKRLSGHLASTGNAIEKRGAVGVLGWTGTLATGTTLANTLNDGRMTIAWYKNAAENAAVLAAGYAAVIAYEEDPAKPLNTLEIKGLLTTSAADAPLFAECNAALYNGLTPITVMTNKVQIMRAVSTYTQNAT